MKHRVSILPLLLLMMVLASCNQTASTEKAVAYNDAIVDLQTRVVDHFDRFVDAVEDYDSLDAIAQLNIALDTARAAAKSLEAMDGFRGDTKLRDAALALINLYATGLDKDFRGIMPVLVSHFATLEQLEAADEVRNKFSEEEDHLFALVEKAQEEFSKAYRFEVVAE